MSSNYSVDQLFSKGQAMGWWLFYTEEKAEANRVGEISTLGTAFEHPMCDLMPSH